MVTRLVKYTSPTNEASVFDHSIDRPVLNRSVAPIRGGRVSRVYFPGPACYHMLGLRSTRYTSVRKSSSFNVTLISRCEKPYKASTVKVPCIQRCHNLGRRK